MKYRCPICKKIIKLKRGEKIQEALFYPFCSERCKMVDLGAWFDGQYKVILPEDKNHNENHPEKS